MKRSKIIKDILITVTVMLLAIFSSMVFKKLNVLEHSTTIFVFAVFLISLYTDGYVYGILSGIVAMLAVNYAFTYPYFKWDFMTPVNVISAVIMTMIAVLTGMLTTKLKEHEVMKAESERERMRANLLRAISHDLRTPLTTIYGASCTLAENIDTLSDEQKRNVLKSIQEDSTWLIRMVENLLSITRIDDGRIKIIKTPIVLDELIESVMSKFTSRYPGQKIEMELPDDIVVIPMDAILIEQVLVNILENAVVHAKGMTKLILRVYTTAHEAVFEVEDNGCGIPKERMHHIFTGCYDGLDNNSDSCKRNAGIGLSVCATIIKAHGGEISAENLKSGGAVFRFALEKEEMIDG